MYAYTPSATSAAERGPGKRDEKEMFLAKLLVGTEILMDRDESSAKTAECRALKVPPIDPRTVTSDNVAGHKYNTVTGYTMW